jgi:ATP adenylyltransferase
MSKSVWAPWREDYILGFNDSKSNGCLFCNAIKQNADKRNLILHRGETTFIMMNKFPYTSGHLMVVPYRHVGVLERLSKATTCELMLETSRIAGILKKAFKPNGLNIGINIGRAAGAGVPGHLHVHIVPRWAGDNSFMPVVGKTRVISVSLETTYKILSKHF